jgi:hypothetical protein
VAATLTMVAILGRVPIGPLARNAGTARLQRDHVVAAAEAEREGWLEIPVSGSVEGPTKRA